MAIKSSASAKPEFCHPSCNEHKPCGGKVCPYEVTNLRRELSGSHSKCLEINGAAVASEQDQTRRCNQSSSISKRGTSANVPPLAITHPEQERSYTDNSDEGTPKTDGLIINPGSSRDQPPKRENKIKRIKDRANGALIDNRLLCGMVIGIILAVVFPLLLLFIFNAARKAILG